MASTGKKWLLGCGIGCGGFVLIGLILSIVGSMAVMRPMERAVDAQRALTEAYGDRDDYAPPADLTADRVEAFLEVRRGLMAHCEEFRGIAGRFEAMEKLDKGGDEPSPLEVLRSVKGVMGAAFGLAGTMGDLVRERNEALNTHGMGLGEYTWLYVLIYNSWLGHPPNVGFDSSSGRQISGQQQRRITDMMERHAAALTSAGQLELAAQWRDEAASLERRDDGVPFAKSGLPADFAEVVAPYRDALEQTYCAEMSEFELGEIEQKGMSFQSH